MRQGFHGIQYPLASVSNQTYHSGMAEVRKLDFSESTPVLEEEDEATLAAIDRGIKAADEGRVVPLEEVRLRMNQWLTRSSSPKTR
jgi:predicted transcriptional regulator